MLSHPMRIMALLILGAMAGIPAVSAQDGVLIKTTATETTEEFGGIEEVVVVDAEGGIETIVLQPPHGVSGALDAAENQVGENLRDGTVICFEAIRNEPDSRSNVAISTTPGTTFVGDINDPCNITVFSGELTITTTITEAQIFWINCN